MPRDHKGDPKLPVQQLAILAVVRFAEPMALTSVFPYLPEMIRSFGVEKEKVAQWAGLVSAVFSLAQSITAVGWGWTSDRIGRKPTILIGLTCTMVCFMFWGMCTSLPAAVAIRAIQGASNGNVGIIRTMVAEMVPEKVLQPKAFSLMPLVWSIGSVFGPAFGGFFARPADQYPGLFGNIKFLKEYPFALPNIVACVFFLVSLFTATLFLRETLETKRHSRDWGLELGEKLASTFRRQPRPRHSRLPRPSFGDAEASAPLLTEARQRALSNASSHHVRESKSIFNYSSIMSLVCYTFLALHSVSYDQLLPVFLNYDRRESTPDNTQLPFKFATGFGLSSDRIGTILTVYGVACGLVQFFVFPPLCARFGALNSYRGAAFVFPVTYLLTPYTALIENEVARYAALLFVLLCKGFVVIISFPCIIIILTNTAPSLKILGTLNGFAVTFSGFGRAIGPAVVGATFSKGVENGYAVAGFFLLAVVALLGAIPPWFMHEGEGPISHVVEPEEAEREFYEDDVEDEDDNSDAPLPLVDGPEDTVAVPAQAADLVDLREERRARRESLDI